jgi:DNA-binding NarL/FixJ family response regulator
MTERRECVLVVEDEFIIAAGLRVQIEAMGIEVCGVAATSRRAIELAKLHRPAVVIMDTRLRGSDDGVCTASSINNTVGSEIIFLTGSKEPAMIARMESARPSTILFKPVFEQQLQAAIKSALCAQSA